MHPSDRLTPRQLEVFALLAKGLTNPEIGALLGVSHNTVRNHVAKLLATLGASSRTEAAFLYRAVIEERFPLRAARSPTDAETTDPPLTGKAAGKAAGRPVIALLPLTLRAPVGTGEALAAGVVEDLLCRLSGWPWLPVVDFASSRQFSGASVGEIRRALGVSYVLSGTLRLSERRARLTIHVVDTATGEVIGSEVQDAALDDLFHAQDLLARRIVACIAPTLLGFETRAAVRRRAPAAFEPWRLTCEGMSHLSRRSRSAIELAVDCFDRSLALDPAFGLTWYGRVWAHTERIWHQLTGDADAEAAACFAAAEQYLALEPEGAQSCIVRGLVAMMQRALDDAAACFERAAVLNGSSARARFLQGQCLGLLGQFDRCIDALDEALHLNPYSASSALYMSVIAVAHFLAGRPEAAIAWCDRALATDPEAPNMLLTKAAACVEAGRLGEAQALVIRQQEVFPHFHAGAFVRVLARSAPEPYLERFVRALGQLEGVVTPLP